MCYYNLIGLKCLEPCSSLIFLHICTVCARWAGKTIASQMLLHDAAREVSRLSCQTPHILGVTNTSQLLYGHREVANKLLTRSGPVPLLRHAHFDFSIDLLPRLPSTPRSFSNPFVSSLVNIRWGLFVAHTSFGFRIRTRARPFSSTGTLWESELIAHKCCTFPSVMGLYSDDWTKDLWIWSLFRYHSLWVGWVIRI